MDRVRKCAGHLGDHPRPCSVPIRRARGLVRHDIEEDPDSHQPHAMCARADWLPTPRAGYLAARRRSLLYPGGDAPRRAMAETDAHTTF